MYISWISSFGLLQETRLMVWALSSETRILAVNPLFICSWIH
jgi:hypothetical protein